MTRLNQKMRDLQAIRQTIDSTGEIRFHIQHSRSGLSTVCRMWHPDGFIMGRASGGGYDKAGTALGQAIELLFPEELKRLPLPERNANGITVRGFYGLSEYNGKRILDGACGLECMLKILGALGFEVERYDTGKLSDMILGRRKATP